MTFEKSSREAENAAKEVYKVSVDFREDLFQQRREDYPAVEASLCELHVIEIFEVLVLIKKANNHPEGILELSGSFVRTRAEKGFEAHIDRHVHHKHASHHSHALCISHIGIVEGVGLQQIAEVLLPLAIDLSEHDVVWVAAVEVSFNHLNDFRAIRFQEGL